MRLWVRALERERLARPVDQSFAPLCERAVHAPTFSLLFLSAILTITAEAPTNIVFRGMANASAAVAIGTNQVLVADDDDNRLRLYNVTGGDPLRVFDWSGALRTYGRQREADIEAAARVGDRV